MTDQSSAAYPPVDTAGVVEGPVVIHDKPNHDTAEWMLTFAAGGRWQTAFFGTERDARKAMALSASRSGSRRTRFAGRSSRRACCRVCRCATCRRRPVTPTQA